MNSNQSGYVSVAWPPFSLKLAGVLEKMAEDQFLILSVKRSGRYVQFAAQGAFGMRMETASNNYLPESERLDELQIAILLGAGWHAPTRSPASSSPRDDPDGSPNFFVDFSASASFEAIANLAVHTLTEVLRVPHPGYLEYKSFDTDDNSIALPALGLKLAAYDEKDKSELLLATLREVTGIDDLRFDDDGDVAISAGSAIAYVRLLKDPDQVGMTSPVLRDLDASENMLARLNEINADELQARFVFRNRTIFCIACLPAEPFVRAHVAQAVGYFCSLINGMDSLLQSEFGGRTAYSESMPSLMRH